MEQPNYFAIIPSNVRYDTRLNPNSKLLYAEITALTNSKGFCWASNDYFSNLYNVSKTSISKWISLLVKLNYISTELVYNENSKEIKSRIIKITPPIEEKLNTYITKVKYPIEEKLIDNNIIINNKSNNILLSEIEISDLTEEEKSYHKIAVAFQNIIRKNILEVGGNTKDIDNTKKTAIDDIRLLITKDKFTKKQIEQVFFFLRDEVPTSEFSWKRNVLSIKTLRKNFNKILVSSSKTNVNTQPTKTNIPDRVVIK